MSIKATVKLLILKSGLLKFRQYIKAPSVAILGYHSVAEDCQAQSLYINRGIATEAAIFREQMRMLRKEFNPVTMEQIGNWLRDGKAIPCRSVAITFDDGYADNYFVAAPIMEQFGVFGAFYLTVDCIQRQELPWFCRLNFLLESGRREKRIFHDPIDDKTWNLSETSEYLDALAHYARYCGKLDSENQRQYISNLESRFGLFWNQLQAPGMMTFGQAKELCSRGHIVGNHSFSHGNLAHVPAASLEQEIVKTHEILEKELERPIRHFSYPHPTLEPQWNETTRSMIERLGYETCVLTEYGLVTRKTSNLLIPRLMLTNPGVDELRWKLEMAFAGIKT